ncbi:RNA polymerase II transcription factor SIII, subunit A [Ascosphaera apis ARSEF 7405]|uniref:RNA polymerase II transcription factor SIII, subunit A n=1 Tax=Ascosphaera apis ARSEF 7405 TaxID=392613 RepID=A0A167XSL5_9EURO|nr:RNA polymerase II transcription factor SIII, subunit A [Ascosphaera apis ARSEF 7405]
MPPPSLRQLATLKCIQNVRNIIDFGDTPFHLAQPILMKIANPKQLRQIEINSPQLTSHTKPFWLEFIKRDIPRHQDLSLPPNPESWHDVYRSLVDEVNRQFESDAARMKEALRQTALKQEQNQAKLIDINDRRVVRHMRSSRKRQFVDDGSAAWSSKRRSGGGGGSGAKKSVLQSFKTQPRVMSTPTHLLDKGFGTVTEAPKGLVEAYKPVVKPTIGGGAAAMRKPKAANTASPTQRPRTGAIGTQTRSQTPAKPPAQRRAVGSAYAAAVAAAPTTSSSNASRAVQNSTRVANPSAASVRKPIAQSESLSGRTLRSAALERAGASTEAGARRVGERVTRQSAQLRSTPQQNAAPASASASAPALAGTGTGTRKAVGTRLSTSNDAPPTRKAATNTAATTPSTPSDARKTIDKRKRETAPSSRPAAAAVAVAASSSSTPSLAADAATAPSAKRRRRS